MTKVLILKALKAESGTYFNAIDHRLVYTGVGKVSAAYHLMKALHEETPDLVLNLGSAGSTEFSTGTLVNCTGFIQRDMDVTPMGFEHGITPYEDIPRVLKYGKRYDHLPEAVCGTGDNFDTSGKTDGYTVIDMEAYALAKICFLQNIPFGCVKYITDGADGSAADDWKNTVEKSAKALFGFLEKNFN